MSSSYRKYNDLATTPAEKVKAHSAQMAHLAAQQKIAEQEKLIAEQDRVLQMQKNQISRQNARASQEAQARARAQSSAAHARAAASPAQYRGPDAPSVKTLEQKKRIIDTNQICVFKISAPWCAPCKVIAPKYNALAKLINVPGKVMLVQEELDDKLSLDVEGVLAFDFYYMGNRVHRQMRADFDALRNNIRGMTLKVKNAGGNTPSHQEMRPAAPHPAAGMQPRRNNQQGPNQGMYPPSAMRM